MHIFVASVYHGRQETGTKCMRNCWKSSDMYILLTLRVSNIHTITCHKFM